jgi:excisionase family DNA binding protein
MDRLPSLLVRPDEAAKLLAVSPRTLWSLTHAGVVPCVRLGKSVRYSMDTLRAIVAQRERQHHSHGQEESQPVSPVQAGSAN